MSKFWEIKTEDYYWTASELQKHIPELRKMQTDDVVNYLRGSGLFIVRKKLVESTFWIRFTMPFALVVLIFLLLITPIKYIITGKWGYSNQSIANWFRSVGF